MLFCSLFFLINIFLQSDLGSDIGRSQRSLPCHCFVDIKGSRYLFLMGKGWRNLRQFQALSGCESHSIRSQQGNSSKLVNQTKFSESVAILQQVLGNWFVFFSETPYRDNNSYVRHSVGLDVIWMSKWKAAEAAQRGRHHRRLFTTTKYIPASTGDPPDPC